MLDGVTDLPVSGDLLATAASTAPVEPASAEPSPGEPSPAESTGVEPAGAPSNSSNGEVSAVPEDSQPGLVAARGLFTPPSALVPEQLYADVVAGYAQRSRERIVLAPRTALTTNTYFGRFPASYWQRWTVTTEVELLVVVTGTGRIALHASDQGGEGRVVAAAEVRDARDREIRLTGKFDKFVDGGALWLEAATTTAPLTLRGVRWQVAPAKVARPTSLVICTHNRVPDCLNTLAALAGDPAALARLDAVYVADQGSDPVEDNPGFAEVGAALGSKLRYLRQPNLGGAGGFTRGLYETLGRHGEHANVLFMDDDVLCEPEIVVRLTAFADRTIEPTIVGGQMLNLLHPNTIHVSAECANLEGLAAGEPVAGALANADLTTVDEQGRRNLQEQRVDTAYNGWWSCLIPAEIVAAIGYPLPLFFQWDDVEYGYRAHGRGFASVSLPGAGVWHADFDWKDWDEWHRYFNLRNALITAALHSRFDGKHVAKSLVSHITRYLLSMQYGLTATLLKALDDFMLGPSILADGGVAAVREVRELRARYPETVMHDTAEVPEVAPGDLPMIQAGPTPSHKPAVLLKRLAYQLLDKKVHQVGTVPADDAYWWHISLFDTAVVTDASQGGVRIRKRDRDLAIRLARHAVRSLRQFIRLAPELQRQYRTEAPRLGSRENWARLYDQD
ncbi:MAG TPA: glycosyltransferase [Pseudonocardiaceae bacterium]|jgi:galactofuranosylgalactofuranosylrhamnosyl-N-acetylglucosaminyl-diphospho-decaprenol beta-1,5/1,6-galactofuranosyltransferase|nr:glycosyltransferase [Pseudonocardiaceae bacterium]